MKYASMLAEKMDEHGTNAWLVNTGWTGGRLVLPHMQCVPNFQKRHHHIPAFASVVIKYAVPEHFFLLRSDQPLKT